ncbi:hypothetical protein B0J11DRAFT_251564 [Dendryphion nanum]|uniref:Uncharacterized protein n=1 Tax=Dendryphion nanum TaxID=256645 RepID=A0A9P9IPP5_9PLEO|nr:hypothetical protein B0J11DRAFT_251564 [Dendryphion nanum]
MFVKYGVLHFSISLCLCYYACMLSELLGHTPNPTSDLDPTEHPTAPLKSQNRRKGNLQFFRRLVPIRCVNYETFGELIIDVPGDLGPVQVWRSQEF